MKIVESNKKKLYYQENKYLFKRFEHKIIHMQEKYK